jgi:hypothetical protein
LRHSVGHGFYFRLTCLDRQLFKLHDIVETK